MDVQRDLAQLKEMHEKGLITTAVYEEQQKLLLSKSVGSKDSSSLPTESQASVFFSTKRNFSIAAKFIGIAIVALAGIWIVYALSDQEGKDSISKFASSTGIGTQVIPWADRADTSVRNIIKGNEQKLANAIQGITHPTGTDPSFSKLEVSKLNDRILANIVITWKGGILSGNYTTSVSWEISKQNHIQAKVTFDSAMTKVSDKNKELLDDYFRTKVYPAFYSDVGG